MKYLKYTHETYVHSHCNIPIYFCNTDTKHLQYISETPETYVCNMCFQRNISLAHQCVKFTGVEVTAPVDKDVTGLVEKAMTDLRASCRRFDGEGRPRAGEGHDGRKARRRWRKAGSRGRLEVQWRWRKARGLGGDVGRRTLGCRGERRDGAAECGHSTTDGSV
jgi:hypothetical protein